MVYAITAMSQQAETFLNKLCDQYINMSSIIDVMNNDLKSHEPIVPVPLFSGLDMREFGANKFAFAGHNASEFVSPNGGGNSSRGPQTHG